MFLEKHVTQVNNLRFVNKPIDSIVNKYLWNNFQS
jgi:hypothetical protein